MSHGKSDMQLTLVHTEAITRCDTQSGRISECQLPFGALLLTKSGNSISANIAEKCGKTPISTKETTETNQISVALFILIAMKHKLEYANF